jgi:hypothetical protein
MLKNLSLSCSTGVDLTTAGHDRTLRKLFHHGDNDSQDPLRGFVLRQAARRLAAGFMGETAPKAGSLGPEGENPPVVNASTASRRGDKPR